MNYVRDYYSGIELPGRLIGFYHVCVSEIMKILDNCDTNKAAGIDGLSGIFIKDGAKILSKPISLSSVPESCKVAKLKPLFKKGYKFDISQVSENFVLLTLNSHTLIIRF